MHTQKNLATQRTLSIIKPDGFRKKLVGEILSRFERAGLSIVAAKVTTLEQETASAFYDVHKSRPFFFDLVSFMCSGPIFISVLEGENAIQLNRELMGATNPKEAQVGTIRADFADSIDSNIVHGSDSLVTSKREIAFFFPELS